jgi:hypothetical protein
MAAIFQQHKDSGLTIVSFSLKHKLANSSFCKYRKLLAKESRFIRARVLQTLSKLGMILI